jgi:DNA-binding NarL/FixJ family response regulator
MADDEEIFLLATAELLRLEGFVVDVARDAFEARDLLLANRYDVLVSDILMPGNLDFSFIQEAGKLSPDLQIILVTAYPSVDTAMQAVHLPVAAYLTKPVDVAALSGHVRRTAAGIRLRGAIGRSQGRLAHWMEDLDQLRASAPKNSDGVDRDMARDVLSLSLGNIAGVLLDMQAVFEMTLGKEPSPDLCALNSCPRLETYQVAVRESIDVLEQTRHAFKSKELGRLRERLEQLQKP